MSSARPIAGHISPLEREWLASRAAGLDVLEIGAFRGRSTLCLARAASSVLSCDHFLGQKQLQPGQKMVDMDEVETDWHRNITASDFGRRVTLFKGSSEQCLHHLQINAVQFDFIFVDGGHDEETVKHDLGFSRLLRLCGTIAFHDYGSERFPQIRLIVDTWAKQVADIFPKQETYGSIVSFKRVR